MEGRVAKLEATVEHIDGEIDELRTDVRELRNWGLAAVGLLLVVIATGYLRLADKSDLTKDEISKMEITLQKISDAVTAPMQQSPAASKRGQ